MLLALDLGTVRTGVAISDPAERFALPSATLTSDEHLAAKVAAVASSHGKNLSAIVVGLPYHADGTSSASLQKAQEFIERLQAMVEVPVVGYDERQTTKIAKALLHGAGSDKKKLTDQVAAQTILQSYIDALFSKEAADSITLAQIRQQAKDMGLPSVRFKTAMHIVAELRRKKARSLLEIGSANGYSAALFAYCLPFMHITTMDKQKGRFELAEKNLGGLKNVEALHADAFNHATQKEYDAVFIDGPKSRVQELFDKYFKTVKVGGTVFVDNTRLTAVRESPYLNTDRSRMRMLENMDAFVEGLKKADPSREAVVHEFDDGLAVVQRLA